MNPIEVRRAPGLPEPRAGIPGAPTFGNIANDFVESKCSEWRGSKSASEWRQTLKVHLD